MALNRYKGAASGLSTGAVQAGTEDLPENIPQQPTAPDCSGARDLDPLPGKARKIKTRQRPGAPLQLQPVGNAHRVRAHGRPGSSSTSSRSAGTPAASTLAYDRMRDLPRLLRLWPKDIESLDRHGLEAIVERLEKALRAERRRGISRHWGYDLGRHAALLRAYRGECATLAQSPLVQGLLAQTPLAQKRSWTQYRQ